MSVDWLLEVLGELPYALLQLLAQPFYYIAILIVALQYRRQVQLERKLFHTRLHSVLGEISRTCAAGLLAGLLSSVVMAGVGATMQTEAVLLLWITGLLLSLIQVRFLCFAYAAGLLGILHYILSWFPDTANSESIGWAVKPLLELHFPSIFALAATLHIAEAVLIRIYGADSATPLFVEGKRGKIVGAYQLQGYWPVPLLLLIPGDAATYAMPWTPLFGGDLWSGGWGLVGFPVLIGFSELTSVLLPREKARQLSNQLFMYSGGVLLLAVGAEYWSPVIVPAGVGCIVFHEAIVWWSRMREAEGQPRFVHDDRGMMILGVLPGSAASEHGIVAGEQIHKVNGVRVRSREDLHQAMRVNSAFCKLEIVNLSGEIKFVQCPLFSDQHHQLGIVLAPDDDTLVYVERRPLPMLGYFKGRSAGTASRDRSREL